MGSLDTGISWKQFPLGNPAWSQTGKPFHFFLTSKIAFIIPISIPILLGVFWSLQSSLEGLLQQRKKEQGMAYCLNCFHGVCQNQSDDHAQAPRGLGSLVLPNAHKGENWKYLSTDRPHPNSELEPFLALFLLSVQPKLYIVLQKARQLLAEEKNH